MRKLITFLSLLLFTVVLPVAAQEQKWVTVYTDDFSGNHYEFEAGRYDNVYLAQSGVGTIYSIKVPPGMQATLFMEDNFRGEKLVLTDDAHTTYLKSKGFATIGLTVSLVVQERAEEATKEPVVTIYMHDNFSGASRNLGPGQYEFAEFGAVGNDQLSSVKIPDGMTVTLYEHAGLKGRSMVLTADARASFLVKNNFNDVTTSLVVKAKPVPAVVPVAPAPVIAVIPAAEAITVAPAAVALPPKSMVTIYQGDFNGVSKALEAGWYDVDQLSIGNDELSSVQVPPGFTVTLFERNAFEGKSLVLTRDTHPQFLEDNGLNNKVSSIKIQAIPRATIFEDDYSGPSASIGPGRYGPEELGISVDALSSVRVPPGLNVTLYEHRGFQGSSVTLKQDVRAAFLRDNFFDNITSSIVVEQVENVLPVITLFQDDFSGRSNSLTAGNYDYHFIGIDNNSLSSLKIPRGFRVTLYEAGGFEGRTLELTHDASNAVLIANNFDNIASSLKIEEIPADQLVVTVYRDSYSGPSISFHPGQYDTDRLAFGDNQLSSARVPRGMRAILYEDEHFRGRSVTLEADADLTGIKTFNDHTSSIVIEDIAAPIATPVAPAQPADPIVVAAVVPAVEAVVVAPVVAVGQPPCAMTSKQYDNATNAVRSKAFPDDKMTTARLATQDKCMNNEQIRGLATLFFEDKALEFLKYAYDLSTEQSEYYLMDDILKFMSSKEEFARFLKEK